jgi:hypothetical protein
MKRPIDPRDAGGTGEAKPPDPETKTPAQGAPSQDAVEAAMARLLDSILPDSRASRRHTPGPRRVRRAS